MSGVRGLFILPDGSSNGTTPLNARLALGGLVASDGASGISIRQGVFYDGLGAVVSGNTDTGTMSYSVRACRFAMYLIGVASSGTVIATNDAVLKVTTTAAPGSNSRIDVIWVRQHSVASDGGPDTDNILQVGVTQGTAAASPTVPAIPTGAMALAQAVMTTGSTSTNSLAITQTHTWTTSDGSAIAVRNSTERDALAHYPGMLVYRLDLDVIEVWKGVDAGWHVNGGVLPGPNLTHQPRRIMKRTAAAQTLSTSTVGAVSSWIADSGDDGNTTGITSNADGSFTFAYAGLYRVYFKDVFAGNATNARAVYIYKNPTINGSAVVTAGTVVSYTQVAGTAVGPSVSVYCELVVAAADTMCVAVLQDSGGNLAVGSTAAGGVTLSISRTDD